MNQGLFWRSLAVQALTVGTLFLLLLALPLDDELFKDYGIAIGPVSWAACSLLTARILALPAGLALLAALAGGVAGSLAGLVAGHGPGMGVALLVFGACCGGYDRRRDAAPA